MADISDDQELEHFKESSSPIIIQGMSNMCVNDVHAYLDMCIQIPSTSLNG